MNEQNKIRTALKTLSTVLSGIARTADEKNRERCPYKTVELRCTYSGGCQNQRRDASHFAVGISHRCAGDDLNFEPVLPEPSAQSQEPRS